MQAETGLGDCQKLGMVIIRENLWFSDDFSGNRR